MLLHLATRENTVEEEGVFPPVRQASSSGLCLIPDRHGKEGIWHFHCIGAKMVGKRGHGRVDFFPNGDDENHLRQVGISIRLASGTGRRPAASEARGA